MYHVSIPLEARFLINGLFCASEAMMFGMMVLLMCAGEVRDGRGTFFGVCGARISIRPATCKLAFLHVVTHLMSARSARQ